MVEFKHLRYGRSAYFFKQVEHKTSANVQHLVTSLCFSTLRHVSRAAPVALPFNQPIRESTKNQLQLCNYVQIANRGIIVLELLWYGYVYYVIGFFFTLFLTLTVIKFLFFNALNYKKFLLFIFVNFFTFLTLLVLSVLYYSLNMSMDYFYTNTLVV